MTNSFDIEVLPPQDIDELINSLSGVTGLAIVDSSDLAHHLSEKTIFAWNPIRIETCWNSLNTQIPTSVDRHCPNEIWIGWLSYEAARKWMISADGLFYPYSDTAPHECYWACYHHYIICYHKENRWEYIRPKGSVEWRQEHARISKLSKNRGVSTKKHMECGIDMIPKERFKDWVRRAQSYITEGDCYQVNISHRFETLLTDEPLTIYKRLRSFSPAPFSAYIDAGKTHVISASPECLFTLDDTKVRSFPIKGTIARSLDTDDDIAQKHRLNASEKDRAELLMITDLIRNDLGQVCTFGSVNVDTLRDIQSFRHVHHGVSEISGDLPSDATLHDVVRALFPGGSITGAPKRRSMEIINELEIVPRHLFTGSIGVIESRRKAVFNIAIRTLYTMEDRLYGHVGAGIVADSDPEMEWLETLVKAKGIISALD